MVDWLVQFIQHGKVSYKIIQGQHIVEVLHNFQKVHNIGLENVVSCQSLGA